MNKNDAIIALAAATMIHDDPQLAEFAQLDHDDQFLLIRDYRDEFASSPFSALRDAKLLSPLINDIHEFLIAAMR
jgi:hypothetical protein